MSAAPDLFAYASRYPAVPGFKDGDTSRAAAASMAGCAALLRRRCLESLRTDGPATADEVAERLSLSILSVRPRFSELNRDGLIADTGERRANASGRSAKVWAALQPPVEWKR